MATETAIDLDAATLRDYLCLELQTPPEDEPDAIQQALLQNPMNTLRSHKAVPDKTSKILDSESNSPSALAVSIAQMWAPGSTLKIKFLSGDGKIREKVKRVAKEWLLYANLKFEWVSDDAPKSHVRIDFKKGMGNNSYIGTSCLTRPQTERTMNLDIIGETEAVIRRKVLHEFGHVLGCAHEHQSPLASFEWNKELIYAQLARPPNNWSREDTYRNILQKLESSDYRSSQYDPESIMLYSYPPEWFKNSNGKGTQHNDRLSKKDKQWIQSCYPPQPNDIGHFSTLQVRPSHTFSSEPDLKDVAFEPVYAEPPRVALGLTWLDLDHTTDISVTAKAQDIDVDNFTVSISSGESRLYSAACSWLELSASETDVKTGEVELKNFWSNGKLQNRTTIPIDFDTRFVGNEPPTVVCWFTGIELGKGSPWRIKTYTIMASPFKFRLVVESAPETDLRNARVVWVAFPKDKEGITGGSFSTDDIPGPENSGTVDWEDAGFTSPPQLMMAVSGFDFNCDNNLRLRLSNSIINAQGMTWHFDSWAGSIMNSATASYIAVCAPKASEYD